jgi:tripeptide aminopeptidase
MFPEAVIDDHLETEFEAYSFDESDSTVQRVMKALNNLGMKPTMGTSGGGSDGNIFRQRGIKSVVVGMGDHGMHTVREYVTIPDLVDTAHLCEELVRA